MSWSCVIFADLSISVELSIIVLFFDCDFESIFELLIPKYWLFFYNVDDSRVIPAPLSLPKLGSRRSLPLASYSFILSSYSFYSFCTIAFNCESRFTEFFFKFLMCYLVGYCIFYFRVNSFNFENIYVLSTPLLFDVVAPVFADMLNAEDFRDDWYSDGASVISFITSIRY